MIENLGIQPTKVYAQNLLYLPMLYPRRQNEFKALSLGIDTRGGSTPDRSRDNHDYRSNR